jgi:hypothetical protein
VTAVPSEHSPSGSARDRPEWRKNLADQLGEDPGRFLELPDAERRALDPGSLIRARVRGFRSEATIRAWIAYERRRATERGTEPRDGILRVLEAAAETVDGEPDHERIAETAAERREQLGEIETEPATFVDENGDEYERTATYVSASSLVAPNQAVTDGGRADE